MKTISLIFSALALLCSCSSAQQEQPQESFNSMRQTLNVTSEDYAEKNKRDSESLLNAIQQKENSPEKEADLNAITKISSLEAMMKEALNETEHRIETDLELGRKKPVGWKPKDENKLYMGDDSNANGGEGNGLAFTLKEKWDLFTIELNTIRKSLGGEEIPNPALPNPNLEGSWAEQTFQDKPVVVIMTMLEKYKLDVGNMVAETIELLD